MTNKLKKFVISPEMLLFLGSGKFEVIANNLPSDVKLVTAFVEDGRINIIISSEEFELVEEGELIPFVSAPVIKKI